MRTHEHISDLLARYNVKNDDHKKQQYRNALIDNYILMHVRVLDNLSDRNR